METLPDKQCTAIFSASGTPSSLTVADCARCETLDRMLRLRDGRALSCQDEVSRCIPPMLYRSRFLQLCKNKRTLAACLKDLLGQMPRTLRTGAVLFSSIMPRTVQEKHRGRRQSNSRASKSGQGKGKGKSQQSPELESKKASKRNCSKSFARRQTRRQARGCA